MSFYCCILKLTSLTFSRSQVSQKFQFIFSGGDHRASGFTVHGGPSAAGPLTRYPGSAQAAEHQESERRYVHSGSRGDPPPPKDKSTGAQLACFHYTSVSGLDYLTCAICVPPPPLQLHPSCRINRTPQRSYSSRLSFSFFLSRGLKTVPTSLTRGVLPPGFYFGGGLVERPKC